MVTLGLKTQLKYWLGTPADFIFSILPARTPHQRVLSESVTIDPAARWREETEPMFGNRLLRFSAPPGDLTLQYTATVEVDHFIAQPERIDEVPVPDLPPEVLPYLWPSRYCESDRLAPTAIREFGNLRKGYGRVAAVCEWVHDYVQFKIGTTISNTSACDTFLQRVGVCRDIAHLAITLIRALNIPARFVTGHDFGEDPTLGPPDFHAYVEAFLGDRWYLFDPAQLVPRTGLVRLATGRDAADTAFATMFGAVQYRSMTTGIQVIDPGAAHWVPADVPLAISTATLAEEEA
jgi:transglutaminase-like putative cysteine protease